MLSSVVYAFKVLFFLYIAATSFDEVSAAIQQISSMSGFQGTRNGAGDTVSEPSVPTVAANASERNPEGAREIGSETIAEGRVGALGDEPQDAKPPGVFKRPRDLTGVNYSTESRHHGLWQRVYAKLAASDPAHLLQAFGIIFITALLYTYRDEDVESFRDFFRPPEIVVEETISCE